MRILGVALLLVAACGDGTTAPRLRQQLRFRGEGKHVAAAEGGAVFVSGAFAGATEIGGRRVAAGDDAVHGLLARIEPDGSAAWAIATPSPFHEGLVADRDGGAVILEEAGDHNRLACYRGDDGGMAWEVTWDHAYPDSLTIDRDGNLAVAGTVDGNVDRHPTIAGATLDAQLTDLYVASFDRSGALRWAHTFPSQTLVMDGEIAPLGDHLAVVVRRAAVPGNGENELWIVEIDAGGAPMREVRLDGRANLPAVAAYQGGLLVVTDFDEHITALDGALAVRWRRAIDGLVRGIAVGDRGIAVAGGFSRRMKWADFSADSGDAHNDAFVAGMRNDGTPTWLYTGHGKGADYAADIVESDGRLWITGAFDLDIRFRGAPRSLPSEGGGIESGFLIAIDR